MACPKFDEKELIKKGIILPLDNPEGYYRSGIYKDYKASEDLDDPIEEIREDLLYETYGIQGFLPRKDLLDLIRFKKENRAYIYRNGKIEPSLLERPIYESPSEILALLYYDLPLEHPCKKDICYELHDRYDYVTRHMIDISYVDILEELLLMINHKRNLENRLFKAPYFQEILKFPVLPAFGKKIYNIGNHLNSFLLKSEEAYDKELIELNINYLLDKLRS